MARQATRRGGANGGVAGRSAGAPGWIVEAKLQIPQPARKPVDRPRLSMRLEQGVSRHLTVVSGPAGAGKTALVAGWLAGRLPAGPVAWLSLDPDDNDPARLWAHLISAVRQSQPLAAADVFAGLPDIGAGSIGWGNSAVGSTGWGDSGAGSIGWGDSRAGSMGWGTPDRVDAALLAEMAARVAALPERTVLVLDNTQCLRAGPAVDSLGALLRYPTGALALVLCGRGAPPVPTGRLRAAGELVEVKPDELAFSSAEVVTLAHNCGLTLRADQAAGLLARTGGWPAGVCLALTESGADPDGFARLLADPDNPIAEYFRTEVLAEVSPRVRGFLLRTSVAEDLTPALADVLTGRRDGAATLGRLHRAHLCDTVPRRDGVAYTYQPLFGSFLRAEADVQLAAELPGLHDRAARWYGDRGESMLAARHAVAAGQWSYAARALLRCAPAVLGEGEADLSPVAELLPDTGAADDPDIAAVLALTAVAHRDLAGAARYGRFAYARLSTVDGERGLLPRAVLRLTEVLLARCREDLSELRTRARQLIDMLDAAPDALVPAAGAMRAIGTLNLGLAQLWSGDWQDADESLRQASLGARRTGLRDTGVAALSHRALALALRGRLTEAAELVEAADGIARPPGAPATHRPSPAPGDPSLGTARLAQAIVHWLRGDDVAARHELVTAAGQDLPDTAGRALLALAQAQLDRSDGELCAAGSALTGSALPGGALLGAGWALPPLVQDLSAVVHAELQTTLHRPDAALTGLTPLVRPVDLDPPRLLAYVAAARAQLARGAPALARSLLAAPLAAAAADAPWPSVEAYLLEALAAAALGHRGTVRVALAQALVVAAPEGLLRPFLAAGPDLAALLAGAHDLVESHQPFGARLTEALAAGSVTGAARPTELVEPISERESVVLRYLPSLLTASDIAMELGVSTNTIKTQIKSLYRKLSVPSRKDAVHRARGLGLL